MLWTKITRSTDGTKIDKLRYVADIMIRFGMSECNPTSTHMDWDQKLSSSMCAKGAESKQQMSKTTYMHTIRCLLFVAQITRPDICYAVNWLSRYGNTSGKQ